MECCSSICFKKLDELLMFPDITLFGQNLHVALKFFSVAESLFLLDSGNIVHDKAVHSLFLNVNIRLHVKINAMCLAIKSKSRAFCDGTRRNGVLGPLSATKN